jgi:hypothetical protein
MAVVNVCGDRNIFEIALAKGKNYQTGAAIARYLEDDARSFDVYVLPRGDKFGEMLAQAEVERNGLVDNPDTNPGYSYLRREFNAITLDRPAVLWNPYHADEYVGGILGLMVDLNGQLKPPSAVTLGDRGVFDSCYVWVPETVTIGVGVPRAPNRTEVLPAVLGYTVKMPPYIVLFHELGHIKQYYEGTAEQWTTKLAAPLREIEKDNLNRHEGPLLTNANLPVRSEYNFRAENVRAYLETIKIADDIKKKLNVLCSGKSDYDATLARLDLESTTNRVLKKQSGYLKGDYYRTVVRPTLRPN